MRAARSAVSSLCSARSANSDTVSKSPIAPYWTSGSRLMLSTQLPGRSSAGPFRAAEAPHLRGDVRLVRAEPHDSRRRMALRLRRAGARHERMAELVLCDQFDVLHAAPD